MPGGGTGMPSCALTASSTIAEPRVALARPPHRDRDASAGPQHAAHLAHRARRVEREHQSFAAQHDVVGARRAGRSARGRARSVRTLSSPSARRAPRRSTSSPPTTSDSTTSPPGPTSRPRRARPRRDRTPVRAPGRPAAAPPARACSPSPPRRARRRSPRARAHDPATAAHMPWRCSSGPRLLDAAGRVHGRPPRPSILTTRYE